MQRLEQAVDAHNRSSKRGYQIRFSVGAVDYEPIRHGSINAMLADADALMYERKRHSKAA